VRAIYAYYKAYDISTVVMGASFRNIGEIEALAGCDRLTISPQLLDQLSKDQGPLVRKPSPDAAKSAPPRIALDEKLFPLDDERGRDGDREACRRHPDLQSRPWRVAPIWWARGGRCRLRPDAL